MTIVVAVAATVSRPLALPVAVFERIVPSGVPRSTCTAIDTVRTDPGAVTPSQVQVTVPFSPTAGVTQSPSALGDADWKVALAGSGSEIERSTASTVPLFWTLVT